MKKRTLTVLGLSCFFMAGGLISCSDDASDEPQKIEKPTANGDSTLDLDNNKLKLNASETDTVNVSYANQEHVAIPNSQLDLTNSNEECVSVDDSVTTDSRGEAVISVKALDVSEDCTAEITVRPADGSGDKKIVVTVMASSSQNPSSELIVLADKTNVSSGEKGTIKAAYTKNSAVRFVSSDPECISVTSSANTNDEGTVDVEFSAVGSNCTAVITVTAGDKSKTIDLKVSDSGSDNPGQTQTGTLTVAPEAMSLNQGETGSINVSYGKNKTLSIASDNTACVSVSSSIMTDDTGSAAIPVSAVGSSCSANIAVSVDGVSKKVAVTVLSSDAPVLRLDSHKLNLLSGDEDEVMATYKDSSKSPLVGKTLSVTSSNTACATASINSVTNIYGEATVSIQALEVSKNCQTTVTVSGENGSSDNLVVYVSGEDDFDDQPEMEPGLSFSPSELKIYTYDSENFVLRYFDTETNTPLAGYSVDIWELDSGDDNCIDLEVFGTTTDSKGEIKGKVTAHGFECSTQIQATSGDDEPAVLNVNVTREISLAGVTVKATENYDKIKYVGLAIGEACEDMLEDYELEIMMPVASSSADGAAPVLHTFTAADCEMEGCLDEIVMGEMSAIMAFGLKNEDADDAIAIGCYQILGHENKKNIEITLVAPEDVVIDDEDDEFFY